MVEKNGLRRKGGQTGNPAFYMMNGALHKAEHAARATASGAERS